MGDHVHHKGEVMFSYRFQHMEMGPNLDGTRKRTTSDVLRDFPVAPFQMDMDMHMFGVMWGPFEDVTVTLMLPVIALEMDHQTRAGQKFTTRTSGIGDISAGALYRVYEDEMHSLHTNFSLSFPSGTIRAQDDTPASGGQDVILPYPMQLGTGSLSVNPGFTYLGQTTSWSWGAQAMGEIQTFENNRDYQVGNAYNLTAWGARKWTSWLSTALRLDWSQRFNYDGADPALNPLVVPTADPKRRAGKRLDVGVSFNLYAPQGSFKGLRFAMEALIPAFQDLDGPQLKVGYQLWAGIQYSLPVILHWDETDTVSRH